jgi:hypothetical protein
VLNPLKCDAIFLDNMKNKFLSFSTREENKEAVKRVLVPKKFLGQNTRDAEASSVNYFFLLFCA